jgi:adenylate kinase
VRLVILGGPGAGKGTQANWISDHLQIPCIATGEILRTAIANQTYTRKKSRTLRSNGRTGTG